MFSDKLIERLSAAINDAISQGEGSWQEKAAELQAKLEAEGANLEEFRAWINHGQSK